MARHLYEGACTGHFVTQKGALWALFEGPQCGRSPQKSGWSVGPGCPQGRHISTQQVLPPLRAPFDVRAGRLRRTPAETLKRTYHVGVLTTVAPIESPSGGEQVLRSPEAPEASTPDRPFDLLTPPEGTHPPGVDTQEVRRTRRGRSAHICKLY